MSRYRIQCATYNGKLAKGRTHSLASGEPSDDLSAWLAPTLEDGGDEAPDFVAVGFQEMIPLVRNCSLGSATASAPLTNG